MTSAEFNVISTYIIEEESSGKKENEIAVRIQEVEKDENKIIQEEEKITTEKVQIAVEESKLSPHSKGGQEKAAKVMQRKQSNDSNEEEDKKKTDQEEEVEINEYINRMMRVFEDKEYECPNTSQ